MSEFGQHSVNKVEYHPKADRELASAVVYYEQQQPGLGRDFLAEVQAVLLMIADHPESGARVHDTEFRRLGLRRFPYLVVYRVLQGKIRVVAVAHGKHRPGYWISRHS